MQYKMMLQDADLKATGARLAVLSFLTHSMKPLTAEEIFDHIRDEHDAADKATIYRILDTFSHKGITTRLEFGEGKFRYELAGDDHHHLICESCGEMEDISDCNISDLEQEIATKKKFLVTRHSLEFYGLCSVCQR